MPVVTVGSACWWAGRKVFLTGHTGFKGSWAVMLLTRLGARVYGYALEPAERGMYSALALGDHLERSTIDDVRSQAALARSLMDAEPEIVIHMAAQPLVRLSYAQPVETYATNVMGTVHLLEAVRHCPTVKACVVVTTDKCYENKEWDWGYRENERMGGHDPYSNSKGCAELVTDAYRSSFFSSAEAPRIASGRAGNVIGGGDWALDRLVPDLVREFGSNKPAIIRNPYAIRPWQHVLDPLSGYLILASRLAEANGKALAEGWNFGPDPAAEQTVGEIADVVRDRWGEGAAWHHDGSPQPHEAGYLKLDSSKAKRRLAWRPGWGVEKAIEETVGWYRAEASGVDMRRFTADQIEAYITEQPALMGDSA